jgi:hypothetical protein
MNLNCRRFRTALVLLVLFGGCPHTGANGQTASVKAPKKVLALHAHLVSEPA